MTTNVLSDLDLAIPLLAAPMAGGPTTPELVIASAGAGGMGFLAGGYKTAEALAEQLAAVRSETATFGVNLFAPNPVPVDPVDYVRYRDAVTYPGPPAPPQRRSSAGKIVGIVVAAIVVLGGIAAGALFLFGKPVLDDAKVQAESVSPATRPGSSPPTSTARRTCRCTRATSRPAPRSSTASR